MRIFCARKLVGFAICTFRFGENGYPFSLPNCTFHGEIIRISM